MTEIASVVPEPSVATSTDLTLERLLLTLVQQGLFDAAQKRDIEVKAPAQNARIVKEKLGPAAGKKGAAYEVSPAELIASFKINAPDGLAVDEDRLAQIIASAARLPYVKIDPLQLAPELVTQMFSQPFARKFVVLPLAKGATHVELAVADPYNRELLENVRRTTGLQLTLKIASKADIHKAITEVYGFRQSVEKAARDITRGDATNGDASVAISNLEQLVRMRSRTDEIGADDKHVVNAVEYLFHYAFDQRASDIHVEPKREFSLIRFRIDGVLHEVNRIPKAVHAPFVARIKTLCRMDIAEKRRPQDGRIKLNRGEDDVEIRVSSLPVAFGEKLVMRIFDPEALAGDLGELGFLPREAALFKNWIGRPHGLILITGPTGSGKSTTLYTALRQLAGQNLNITSVEDPIEMVFEGFNQVAVQPKIELDFATVLRTLLRQDPDVIMVGEIRDRATAEMVIQAALTGHLLLSTLHTNDAASALTRLIDLGVQPFLVASTVLGIMAQRLVRTVCTKCAQEVPLSLEEQAALRLEPGIYSVKQGRGCALCRGTGYKGRSGVFEVLNMTPEVRALVKPQTDVFEVARVGKQQGMMSLREAAIAKLLAGETTYEEVVSVTGEE
jgi:general secretion pathway protein E